MGKNAIMCYEFKRRCVTKSVKFSNKWISSSDCNNSCCTKNKYENMQTLQV